MTNNNYMQNELPFDGSLKEEDYLCQCDSPIPEEINALDLQRDDDYHEIRCRGCGKEIKR